MKTEAIKLHTVTIPNIDFDLLMSQRGKLEQIQSKLSGDEWETIEGILNLCESITDQIQDKEETDLFDDIENLPNEVKQVLDEFAEKEEDYETCQALVNALNVVGYTCDYDLSAQPHNLKKMSN